MFDDTITFEFIGGSQDGLVVRAKHAPDYLELRSKGGWVEVYERQNEEPPFFYVQIGYVKKEQWK